eukprot:13582403-Alexandrium_andersonii.AAC.1
MGGEGAAGQATGADAQCETSAGHSPEGAQDRSMQRTPTLGIRCIGPPSHRPCPRPWLCDERMHMAHSDHM